MVNHTLQPCSVRRNPEVTERNLLRSMGIAFPRREVPCSVFKAEIIDSKKPETAAALSHREIGAPLHAA